MSQMNPNEGQGYPGAYDMSGKMKGTGNEEMSGPSSSYYYGYKQQ